MWLILIVHKSASVEGSKHDFAPFQQDNAAFLAACPAAPMPCREVAGAPAP